MTKIVYNRCYGGFSLSTAAIKRYHEIKGIEIREVVPMDDLSKAMRKLAGPSFETLDGEYFHARDLKRDDSILVQVVEELGTKANGKHAELGIKELSSGTKYRIDEYDGSESVMTIDDYEWSIA